MKENYELSQLNGYECLNREKDFLQAIDWRLCDPDLDSTLFIELDSASRVKSI
jgi:hypothetical protein